MQSEVLTRDPESTIFVAQEDAPTKSYASIVSSQTKKGPTKIYAPTNTSRIGPPKAVKQTVAALPQTEAPEASNPTTPSVIDVSEANYAEEKQPTVLQPLGRHSGSICGCVEFGLPFLLSEVTINAYDFFGDSSWATELADSVFAGF
uniref:Uncharacterized protein n=1 Tax=Solanum lycopersicum TaxID=4081 RepID=K4AW84_SOLLC